jgi:hypothetical protein
MVDGKIRGSVTVHLMELCSIWLIAEVTRTYMFPRIVHVDAETPQGSREKGQTHLGGQQPLELLGRQQHRLPLPVVIQHRVPAAKAMKL